MTHHGGTETRSRIGLIEEEVTEAIIGAAIEIHRELGPGLLESAYEECLCHELHLRKFLFRRQLDLPVQYKGLKLDCGYRIDLLVNDSVIVETQGSAPPSAGT